MKQKLAIASVLMEDPDIMIFDEPFNGIDNKTVENIRKILLEEKNTGKQF
jgi:ABC-2 type transport system ATP-binding protein